MPGIRINASTNPLYRVTLTAADFQYMYDYGWEYTIVVKAVLGGQFTGWGLTAASDPGWGLIDRERVGFGILLDCGDEIANAGFVLARPDGFDDEPIKPGAADEFDDLGKRAVIFALNRE